MGVKVTALDAASAIDSTDLVALVDVSDTSAEHPAGNSVRATLTQLAAALAAIGAYATDTELAAVSASLAAIATTGSASNLEVGTVPTARLGSGSASSSTYLRGDQTWSAISDVSSVGGSLYLFANYY